MEEKGSFIPLKFRPKVKGESLESSGDRPTLSYDIHSARLIRAVVCLNVKDDNSQAKVLQEHIQDIPLFFLNLDELGLSWNFSFYEGELVFFTQTAKILPKGIYCRPYLPESTHPRFHIFNHLMRALDCWDGKIIGPRFTNFQNSSKPYQLSITLKKALVDLKSNKIRFPDSYIIKGTKKFDKLTQAQSELIVKSSSGIRSEVATANHFNKWDRQNINYLPTFFQEACYGPDIRVHCFDNRCWSIIIRSKEGSIDYRYASKKGNYEKLQTPEVLQAFCQICVDLEKTPLAGLDFVKTDQAYVCLESNPNPGWAGFHRFSKEEPLLAKALMEQLNHD